jgi:hypothetical protein
MPRSMTMAVVWALGIAFSVVPERRLRTPAIRSDSTPRLPPAEKDIRRIAKYLSSTISRKCEQGDER